MLLAPTEVPTITETRAIARGRGRGQGETKVFLNFLGDAERFVEEGRGTTPLYVMSPTIPRRQR